MAMFPRSEGNHQRGAHQLPQGHPLGPGRVPAVVPFSSPLPTGHELTGNSKLDIRRDFGLAFGSMSGPVYVSVSGFELVTCYALRQRVTRYGNV